MDARPEFEGFFEQQFGPLVGALWAYCGDRTVAEDCAAEALARAARDWEKVSQMAHAPGWLHRVAFNVANSHFRRRRAERGALARHGEPAESEDRAGGVVAVLAVREAMASLSRRQRQAVALFYFAELSVVEIADVMATPENTVKSHLHRARSVLRVALSETSLEEAPDAR